MIRSCQIGGDPDKEAFLERDLDIKLVEAQEDGIKILSVTPFTISRAWSCKQQKYVSTLAFIIICENGPIEEEKLCTDCKWYNYTCECPVHCTQDTKIAWKKAEGDK